MKQIQNGIPRFGIEVRRCIDVVLILVGGRVESDAGVVDMVRNDAVRYVLDLPWLGWIAWDEEGAGEFDQVAGDSGIACVECEGSIDPEAIGIDLRQVGLGGEGPDAARLLLHGGGLAFYDDGDFLGIGSEEMESYGAIGVNFG